MEQISNRRAPVDEVSRHEWVIGQQWDLIVTRPVDTGRRLSRYFGLNDVFWTGFQLEHEAARVKDEVTAKLARIKPVQAAPRSTRRARVTPQPSAG